MILKLFWDCSFSDLLVFIDVLKNCSEFFVKVIINEDDDLRGDILILFFKCPVRLDANRSRVLTRY